MIGDIISGIDATKLGDVLDGLNTAGGTADVAEKILESAGTLTIKKGADSVIDKLLNDFGVIDRAMKGREYRYTRGRYRTRSRRHRAFCFCIF